MGKIKNILQAFIPPIVFQAFRKPTKQSTPIQEVWSGDYSSWSEAKAQCSGYDSDLILQKCKTALLKVKNGEAVYERDSVLFDEIQYSWGLLAGLQRAALENDGRLCVLDFGGSLGSTYYQNREFLSSLKNLQWCIVEQPHFVKCGKENFTNEQLKFYNTIEDCMTNHHPNILLLSSVLQYLERPYEWIVKLRDLEIPSIVIDRTAFIDSNRDILTIQNVPEEIYKASYPAWFFSYSKFKKIFEGKYRLISDFDNGYTKPTVINGQHRAHWRGLILKK